MLLFAAIRWPRLCVKGWGIDCHFLANTHYNFPPSATPIIFRRGTLILPACSTDGAAALGACSATSAIKRRTPAKWSSQRGGRQLARRRSYASRRRDWGVAESRIAVRRPRPSSESELLREGAVGLAQRAQIAAQNRKFTTASTGSPTNEMQGRIP
jgi:hypothetical protein